MFPIRRWLTTTRLPSEKPGNGTQRAGFAAIHEGNRLSTSLKHVTFFNEWRIPQFALD
jgi:hypothetical protein